MRGGMKKQDVARVFRRKKTWATPCFLFHWRANECCRARVAFAFSRSVGNAVARNRFKRRLRELVRRHFETLAWDIVVVARKPLAGITNEIWQSEIARIAHFGEENRKHSRSCSA